MEILKKFWSYITLKKSSKKDSAYLRQMHTINKISILMFLVAMVILVVKLMS